MSRTIVVKFRCRNSWKTTHLIRRMIA